MPWIVALCFASFLIVIFSAFFFWGRLVVKAEANPEVWSASLVASLLACAVFIVCFAIGVWFSIARLKGDGWTLSA